MPDSCRVLSGSRDCTLRVWNLESGKCLQELKAHPNGVTIAGVTPDGKRAVSGSAGDKIQIWDLEGRECLRTPEPHIHSAITASVTSDGRRVISGGWDRTLRVWDLENEKEIARFYAGAIVSECAVGSDGIRIAVGDRIGRVYFLVLDNVVVGPKVVTAWHSPSDDGYAIGCPLCRTWSKIPECAIGTERPCPHCWKAIKLNLFTINADWRSITAAWRSEE
jgi:WD40 repeat protein